MDLKESFETEVIEASKKKPVLVDFWAPWCGPCQILGPVLEEIAQERNKDLRLIKVNVDNHQNLATQFGVRGIPHVTLFHEGKAINSFSGALSKPQVNSWLDEHLPSEEKNEWNDLEEKWSEVPNEKAIPPLKSFVAKYPDHEDANVLLARHLAFYNIEEAAQYVEDVKMESGHYDKAQFILRLKEFEDHPDYLKFIDQFVHNDLLFAFKQLNKRLLEASENDKRAIEKIGVALYSIVDSKEKDVHKARKVFDMYTT